ncbi:putative ATPase [Paenibacillus sp. W4I10]|uniref:ATP-dependent nuclease n=1 Tax=Paenibacillus sp. W4I10 TaxID=3042298 RepID=UPI00277F12F1|nr:ATP-binding protein [Paenibacillus sp. W4I10]MDQ0719785.1 putative ATPase [Paenibacillus sp. W4I10]
MKILNVRIENYKSIKDTGEINLHNKINALAGKNNTGKSAFIEAIYKVLEGNLVIIPTENLHIQSIKIVMEISLSNKELDSLHEGVDKDYILQHLEKFRLTLYFFNNNNTTVLDKIEAYYNNFFRPVYENKTSKTMGNDTYMFSSTKSSSQVSLLGIPNFLINLFKFLKSKIVYVVGSRYVPSTEGSSLNRSLNINGTNLNGFLYSLHNNEEETFDIIVETFTQIFTDVTSIRTPIDAANQTFISITFEGLDTPIPLSQCGSGYTHVLLLLCVLYTKENSIVLFDEPQVFLHPSAEKAIYDLVSESSEHQFIFTTHSPILINFPSEKHLFHVSKLKGISSFTQLEQIQELLQDIGVSNSDYALSDKVIFVEGQTEEHVIPKILSHFGIKQIGYNYRILNMKGTGRHFIKKTAMREHKDKLDLVLSGVSQSPIPYKIIIDADNKNDGKINELRESYGENIIILERREYENFFLDCYQELSEIINQNLSIAATDPDRIKSEIDYLLSSTDDNKLFPRRGTTNVLKDVVGSELLERLFEGYSLHYNKIVHGMELTELVLNNTPEKLEFFKNELQNFIKG